MTPSAGDPLIRLRHSSFDGRDPDRDDRLAATAEGLPDAGADPNAVGRGYGVPALFAVTGRNNAPRM